MVKKRATRKRSTRSKAPVVRRRRAGPNEVELSDVRRVVERKIKQLKKLQQTPRVMEATGRMEEALAQVTQMCGDWMIFPI